MFKKIPQLVWRLVGISIVLVSGSAHLAYSAQSTEKKSEDTYNPLRLAEKSEGKSIEATVKDASRKREIPVRIYLPASTDPVPVILYSHGLGGSREASRFMGEHWSKRGYIGVFLQHPGSDESIWKDKAIGNRMSSLRDNASYQNLVLRCQDVVAVLDQLAIWNGEAGHPLKARCDLEHVGMSGHSFGAHTTQAVSGQNFPLIGQRYLEQRIDAAIAFSPSSPSRGKVSDSFQAVKIPWMLMTGTKDTAPVGDQTVESRLKVFPSLPSSIDRYELVLDGAEHSVFTDPRMSADRKPRNPKHHQAILALSTAFWDAYLQSSPEALQWLQGEEARQILDSADRWQVGLKQP